MNDRKTTLRRRTEARQLADRVRDFELQLRERDMTDRMVRDLTLEYLRLEWTQQVFGEPH